MIDNNVDESVSAVQRIGASAKEYHQPRLRALGEISNLVRGDFTNSFNDQDAYQGTS